MSFVSDILSNTLRASKETPDLWVTTRGNQLKEWRKPYLFWWPGYSMVEGGEGGAQWKRKVARLIQFSFVDFG
jgi:hypothetical protein